MEMLKDHAAVAAMLRLMEENGRQEQAAEFSNLIAAVDSVGQQYEGLLAEVRDLRQQLAEATKERHPLKDNLTRTVQVLEVRANGVHTRLQVIHNRIAITAQKAVDNFKRMDVSTLDTAISNLRVDKLLEATQQKIYMCVDDLDESIHKVEAMGQELRSVGSHVKNAGRVVSGKETQAVDGGQEGRFQMVVLAPMRTARSTLEQMGRTVYSAQGAVDRLGHAADRARGKRERSSVRRRLEQKEECPVSAPAKESREAER